MKKQTVLLVLALLVACSVEAFAAGKSKKENGRRQGPPPEAYKACVGKSAGDTAKFTSPRGDTVTGTCEKDRDQLVLRPDRPPQENNRGKKEDTNSSRKKNGRRQGPPPEAYKACVGKSAGDTAKFTSLRGDTVTGTCEKDRDQLVLRPDRAVQEKGDRGKR